MALAAVDGQGLRYRVCGTAGAPRGAFPNSVGAMQASTLVAVGDADPSTPPDLVHATANGISGAFPKGETA